MFLSYGQPWGRFGDVNKAALEVSLGVQGVSGGHLGALCRSKGLSVESLGPLKGPLRSLNNYIARGLGPPNRYCKQYLEQ